MVVSVLLIVDKWHHLKKKKKKPTQSGFTITSWMKSRLVDLSASPYWLMSQLIPIYTANCYLRYFSFSIFCVHLQNILQPTFSFHVESDLIMSTDLLTSPWRGKELWRVKMPGTCYGQITFYCQIHYIAKIICSFAFTCIWTRVTSPHYSIRFDL